MSGGDDVAAPHGKPDDKALVGYGRPPTEHRFKAGQSGNPRGRPRKTKAIAAPPPALTDSLAADLVLLGEADRPIKLHEGGSPTTLSTVSAVYRSMAVAAVKGNRFAQRTFTERVQQAEARRRQQAIEVVDIASKFKEAWTAVVKDAERRGIPAPTVRPHPADILEGRDGMPYVVGPANDPEAKHWAQLQARAVDADMSIRVGLADFKKKSMQKYEQFIFDDMVHEHRLRLAPPRRSQSRHSPHAQLSRPTVDEMQAFNQAMKARYRRFTELTASERKSFLWEVERYDRKHEASVS